MRNAHRDKEFFDDFSQIYDKEIHEKTLGTKMLSEIETNFILEELPVKSKDVLLEIGIGSGRVSYHLARKTVKVVGIDISTGMINKAKEKLRDKKNVQFILADVRKSIPLRNESVNHVYCIRVLKYIVNWKTVIKEVARILKKNSIFIFDISNLYSVAYLGSRNANYRLFKPAEVMETLKREGFKIVKMKPSSRLPFPLYQRVNNRTFLNILTKIERLMSTILPPTLLSRSILVAVKAQTI